MIALIWSGFSPVSLLIPVTISLLYYMRRGTCKFGCKFHHLKQGGNSGCLANLVAATGLDPSKHLGKEITSLHNCICRLYGSSGCGEGREYETLTLNCLLFVNHNH
ncbi:PREDICTED: uncharacterized protein LOC107881859 [Prunus mume]|uniref:Uncharacterized protein LOC107881859 n=1 Tax=Prunus mume TaxID=102107 RepID=A0ABM1LY39_PRUMU|nr:PREDICTED: uncharacterized protein LOC107881859 [Prunus mume]